MSQSTPRVSAHPVYPKVQKDPHDPRYHWVTTPRHQYRGVDEQDLPVLLQHLRDNENYDGLPVDFRVRYVEGFGVDDASTDYERWGGEASEDAIEAHVGDVIDWDDGRAQVIEIYDDGDGRIDQEGEVAWVTFIVRPVE